MFRRPTAGSKAARAEDIGSLDHSGATFSFAYYDFDPTTRENFAWNPRFKQNSGLKQSLDTAKRRQPTFPGADFALLETRVPSENFRL
jgi:hypothetical protein